MRDIDTSASNSNRPASTTESSAAGDCESRPPIGYPAFICGCVIATGFLTLLFRILFHSQERYYDLDLYVDSIAVSYATASPAEWSVRFLEKTPYTDIDFSLNMLYARLLRRDKPLSTAAIDSFRRRELVGGKPIATTAFFNTTAAIEGVRGGDGAGTVVWDFRVEAIVGMTPENFRGGYLILTCADLPVRFWSDPTTETVKGSLLGKLRECDYSFRQDLQDDSLSDASEKIWH